MFEYTMWTERSFSSVFCTIKFLYYKIISGIDFLE